MHLLGLLGLTACDGGALDPTEPAQPSSGAAASAAVVGTTDVAGSPELLVALRYGIADAQARVLPSSRGDRRWRAST